MRGLFPARENGRSPFPSLSLIDFKDGVSIVEGEVVRIDQDEGFLSIGYKSERSRASSRLTTIRKALTRTTSWRAAPELIAPEEDADVTHLSAKRAAFDGRGTEIEVLPTSRPSRPVIPGSSGRPHAGHRPARLSAGEPGGHPAWQGTWRAFSGQKLPSAGVISEASAGPTTWCSRTAPCSRRSAGGTPGKILTSLEEARSSGRRLEPRGLHGRVRRPGGIEQLIPPISDSVAARPYRRGHSVGRGGRVRSLGGWIGTAGGSRSASSRPGPVAGRSSSRSTSASSSVRVCIVSFGTFVR